MVDTQDRLLSLIAASGKDDAVIERELSLPRSTVYDWRNGRSKSYKKYLSQLATYFNVSTDYLLGNEQKNKPPMSLSDLTPHELDLIMKLREGPEDVTAAVYRAAGVNPDTK